MIASKKILLVEDDPMIVEIYGRKFSAAGFEVSVASSGKMALEKARSDFFDLVLLDIVLPEMNGMEILEQFRNPKNGYASDLKIVMFSNLNEKTDRDRAIELGASGFIPKTEYAPSQLVEEVSRLLRQFEMQKQNAEHSESTEPAS